MDIGVSPSARGAADARIVNASRAAIHHYGSNIAFLVVPTSGEPAARLDRERP
jgi:hypothetical protein